MGCWNWCDCARKRTKPAPGLDSPRRDWRVGVCNQGPDAGLAIADLPPRRPGPVNPSEHTSISTLVPSFPRGLDQQQSRLMSVRHGYNARGLTFFLRRPTKQAFAIEKRHRKALDGGRWGRAGHRRLIRSLGILCCRFRWYWSARRAATCGRIAPEESVFSPVSTKSDPTGFFRGKKYYQGFPAVNGEGTLNMRIASPVTTRAGPGRRLSLSCYGALSNVAREPSDRQ